jgi:hypothetical protein
VDGFLQGTGDGDNAICVITGAINGNVGGLLPGGDRRGGGGWDGANLRQKTAKSRRAAGRAAGRDQAAATRARRRGVTGAMAKKKVLWAIKRRKTAPSQRTSSRSSGRKGPAVASR